MKKILAIILTMILALGAVFGLTACGDDGEQLVGFDIDFAKAVAKELNLEVEFKEIDWDSKETELNSYAIDVIWNGFTYTTDRDNGYYDADRQQQIGGLDFTKAYMTNKQVAIVKKASVANYKSNADFAGKTGCAEASSAGKDVITDVLSQTASELGKQLDCLVAVKAGTYDYAIVDKTLASEYIENKNGAYNSSLAVVDVEGVDAEEYAVAFREGSNLRDVFNVEMAKLYANGKAQEIAEKYSLGSALVNGFDKIETTGYQYPTSGDYQYVKTNGKIIIGYTIFAPMAYMQAK